MPKSELDYRDSEYAPVARRIALFYGRHPDGRIITELVSRSENEITFRALVYRTSDELHPATTGWASERPGDGDVNSVACLENTETSAIGRALANLGFTASSQRPSAEEMAKAARERVRVVRERAVHEARQPIQRTKAPSTGVPFDYSAGSDRLQSSADMVLDALAAVDHAEAMGFSVARAGRLRAFLLAPDVYPEKVERIERALRGWLARWRPLGAIRHDKGAARS